MTAESFLRPELQTRLDEMIRKRGLEPVADLIRPLARECVVLTRGEPAPDAPVGASRIGGSPDVPAKFKWPREADRSPFCFIAQVNLAEIPSVSNHPLPDSGLLMLFVGSDEPAYAISSKLVHLDGALKRKPMPKSGEPNESYESLAPHLLTATLGISLPDYCSPRCPDFSAAFDSADGNGDAMDRYIDLCSAALNEGERRIGQLLGWPMQISGDVCRDAHLTHTKRPQLRFMTHKSLEQVQADAQKRLVEGNTESWEYLSETVLPVLHEYKANEVAERAAEAEWTGLLSIHSDRKVGLCIWDAGFFTAVIRQADLAAHRFDDVYCRVESS